MKNNIFIFTHLDLDGVVSYLILKWYYKQHIPVKFTTPNKFREDFEFWAKDNLNKYNKIFILDMDVSESQDLIDYNHIMVFDHHSSHTAKYKNAKGSVATCSSNAKLIYNIFSRLPNAKFTKAQKKLIALADDYDSYTLKVPESYELNILLFESQNKPFNFIRDFEEGLVEFSPLQQNIITLHKRKLKRTIEELSGIYHNTLKIQGKDRHVVGTFATVCINEIADFLVKTYDADLAFVVNMSSGDNGHISFRKGKASDLDVSKVAQILCEGGGRADTAGGQMSEKFQQFTKLLTPYN